MLEFAHDVSKAPPSLVSSVELVVPVHNEEAVLERNVIRILEALAHLDYHSVVTIADNASTDSTASIGERLAESLPGVRYVRLEEKGRGRALRRVWSSSAADVVAYMDADLSTSFDDLGPLLGAIAEEGYDLAFGSRLLPDSSVTRGAKREFVSRMYNLVLRVVLKVRTRDAQCGFKAMSADAAHELIPLVHDDGWFFDTELIVATQRAGRAIREIPVHWVDDPDSSVAIVRTAIDDLRGVARLRDLGANTVATWAIGLLAAVMYLWGIAGGQYANSYYAAAARSASVSWRSMFFGSLDPGNFITVDKPPLSTALMGLSGRLFGFSPTTMLLPEAVLGVASVLLLHRLVRKWAGDLAAHLAATALAVTPVATLMFRYNNPDALLTFLCIAAALAMWTAIETGRTRWLLLSALLIGLGFDAKMLQVLLVVPALFGAYAVSGPGRLARRLEQLCAATVACVVAGGWWVVVVATMSKADRPYIGSTGNNSLVSLIVGYNGVQRVFGPSNVKGEPQGIGFGRITNVSVAGQVSWLLPIGLCGLLAGLWLAGRGFGANRSRAGWILFGAWAFVCAIVFGSSSGTFHSYYTVQMAPALAAGAGAGAVALWRLGVRYRSLAWALPAAVVINALWAELLLRRTPYFATWLVWPLALAALIGAVALAWAAFHSRFGVTCTAAALAAASLLAGPLAYSATTVAHPMTGSAVHAGPRRGASHQTVVNLATRTWTRDLVAYLVAHRGHARYLCAAFASRDAAPIIIATGQPVITMGGFVGGDPTPTLSQLKALIADHELRYVFMPSSGAASPQHPLANPSSWSRTVTRDALWIESHGSVVPNVGRDGAWLGTLYDLRAAR